MLQKPTYEELEERIRALELEISQNTVGKSKIEKSPSVKQVTNEGRFRNLIEGSIQGILIHRNHKPLFVNKQWATIHGYSIDEILCMDSVIHLISPHDQPRMIEYKDVRIKGGKAPVSYEYEGVRKDGSLVWLENRVMVVQWDGKPAIQTIIVDITDRKHAENALKESQSRYRAVVEDLPALICSFLPGGEITFVNQLYCEYFDKSFESLVGTNFLSLIPEADQQTVIDNISALSPEIPTQSHEHAVIGHNGIIRWQRWTNRAIFNDKGKAVGYQSIGVDITERKQAELALKESEELHRITLSNISDAVFITDDSGLFTFICPNVSVIFGYNYEEVNELLNIDKLLGSNIFDRSELDSKGEIKNIECVIYDKFGVKHTLLVNVKLVSIKGGTILFTCHDITERKRTYEVLQENEERYRQLYDNASDSIMIFDADTNQFEDANPATLGLFMYTKEEFTQLTVEDISAEKEKTKAAVAKMKSDSSGGNYVPLRYFKKKDGGVFPGEIYAGSFISKGRKKIIGAVRDISNRLQAEETIRALSFSLLTAQEMERKRIASDLHDDLGQALAILKIRIKNFQNKLPSNQDELKEEYGITLNYTDQIIKKVRKLSHGLTPIILDDFGLTASLQSLTDDFSEYTSANIQRKIANIDGLFPSGVEITIYRIFQEIFNNIHKHARAHHVEIEIKRLSDNVYFEIKDDGKGFDHKKIDLNTPNKKGIGLATMNERVMMLGGSFEIQSQMNEGTTIFFIIPFE
jgi:PAS domain S-box-containing protein